jgi:hypothetical protein
MYTASMKRLQIYIEPELDELLAQKARREGTSKAALIRDAVDQTYGSVIRTDPLDEWAGGIDEEPGSIDAVVYDR